MPTMDKTSTTNTKIIAPYGGTLVDLSVPTEQLLQFREKATHLPSVQLSDRSVCDLEMLTVGGLSPLDRFMGKREFEQVVHEMRLANGTLFPIPITLPVMDTADVKLDGQVVLRDSKNNMLAIMTVDEIYEWDRDAFCHHVLGTRDLRHPLIAEMNGWGPYNLSGSLQVLMLPPHFAFREFRLGPRDVRTRLEQLGHPNVVAFQTRNPMHRVHEELTRRAAESVDGTLLLQPAVGLTKRGDVDYYTRVLTYKAMTRYYDQKAFLLALLPLAMRMAGPREAVWHAIIRRNYGANHFIVGRDHAGPGNDSKGKPFYGPYDAQQLAESVSAEIGVRILPFKQYVYLPQQDRYEEADKIPAGEKTASISGTQVREEFLERGVPLPAWFTRPEVAQILARECPPRHQQGVCIWLTGLASAGKSTTAGVLTTLLVEKGRHVTVLDGDVARTFLSKGLSYSKDDRDMNVRRIGFVAAELVRQGGVVVCSVVSPYRATRNEVRAMMAQDHFVEVYVDTPLEVCEQRDTKGVYARARRGEIQHFTGLDDPYEAPQNPELHLETLHRSAEENAAAVLGYLADKGFVIH